MTRKEFNLLVKKYKLKINSKILEELSITSQMHQDNALIICEQVLKIINEYQKTK